MLRILPALPLVFITAPLLAQDLTGAETALLPRVIDSLCIDLVITSNGCEQVFLLTNSDMHDTADLIILTDRRTTPGSQPLLVRRAAVYNGAMWGMSPSLEPAGGGQFQLHSGQTGIGRNLWTLTLTMGWAGDELAISSFSYSSYDRAYGGAFDCTVNYFEGNANAEITDADVNTLETFEAEFAPGPLPVTEASAFEIMPDFCETAIQRYFEIGH